MLTSALMASACVDAGDPEVSARQQDERIEVNGCSPGFLELGEEDNLARPLSLPVRRAVGRHRYAPI